MFFSFIKKIKKVNADGAIKKFPKNAIGIDRNKVTHGKGFVSKGLCTIDFWRESSGNTIIFGNNFEAKNLIIRFKGNNSKLIIGDDVKWSGYILIVGNNREVIIGNNSTSKEVYILARDADVTIGHDCMLSRQIEIRSSDVHKIYNLDTRERMNKASNVTIGNSVWIAAKATISKGAVIQNGCVVGAASFVNKAFTEENVVIAGSPAKIVKRNIYWER